MHCRPFGLRLKHMEQQVEFRAYGNELVSWIARYLEEMRDIPVSPASRPGDLRKQLPAQAPEQGESLRAIVDDFQTVILPHVTHWNHPGFHGYFSISASGPGI